jgi:hypothetical protein
MCLKESLPIFTNVAKVNFKIKVLPFIVADNYTCFDSNKKDLILYALLWLKVMLQK